MQKWVFKPVDSKVNQIHNTNVSSEIRDDLNVENDQLQ